MESLSSWDEEGFGAASPQFDSGYGDSGVPSPKKGKLKIRSTKKTRDAGARGHQGRSVEVYDRAAGGYDPQPLSPQAPPHDPARNFGHGLAPTGHSKDELSPSRAPYRMGKYVRVSKVSAYDAELFGPQPEEKKGGPPTVISRNKLLANEILSPTVAKSKHQGAIFGAKGPRAGAKARKDSGLQYTEDAVFAKSKISQAKGPGASKLDSKALSPSAPGELLNESVDNIVLEQLGLDKYGNSVVDRNGVPQRNTELNEAKQWKAEGQFMHEFRADNRARPDAYFPNPQASVFSPQRPAESTQVYGSPKDAQIGKANYVLSPQAQPLNPNPSAPQQPYGGYRVSIPVYGPGGYAKHLPPGYFNPSAPQHPGAVDPRHLAPQQPYPMPGFGAQQYAHRMDHPSQAPAQHPQQHFSPSAPQHFSHQPPQAPQHSAPQPLSHQPPGWSRAQKAEQLARQMETNETDFITAGLGRPGGGAPLGVDHAFGQRQQMEAHHSPAQHSAAQHSVPWAQQQNVPGAEGLGLKRCGGGFGV